MSISGGSNSRPMASMNTKNAITIKNNALINPDNISALPYLVSIMTQNWAKQHTISLPVGVYSCWLPLGHDGCV